jgi:tRNA (mo5U34)-methyltransferase
MLNAEALFEDLVSTGLGEWCPRLEPLLQQKVSDAAHGNLVEWRGVLAALPPCNCASPQLDSTAVTVGPGKFLPEQRAELKALLMSLRPWRKGPFQVGDILIDSEWRCDLKWLRLQDRISPLTDRLVLDVGCGNGYYALRMLGAGARMVLAIDPMLLYVVQHRVIRHFMSSVPVHVLPLRLHELPEGDPFDTVFSMGVLYHQRDPAEHLKALHRTLTEGGELVLETLVLPGSRPESRTPERYARMRNVWQLPTMPLLMDWLERAGFADACIVDVTRSTVHEQRSTEWMPFDSLAEALDPLDPGLTVEGWPAPTRAIVVCSKFRRR